MKSEVKSLPLSFILLFDYIHEDVLRTFGFDPAITHTKRKHLSKGLSKSINQ